ncbi:tetratricopeptide repeat protein [Dyadobacter jejuensis]|uniref:Tetratricopeptide repeat protein n=1 Tax=Dyadobacter jejuensis TaxID=1082580 RepID=A0A316AN72_9BACT|nr:tetratricopeptide repeat protein [Dyadobacter jejuensis]PWJ58230.1 tetratricopeptide repeat protein [Dyadobacter jejuensis]
MIYRFVKIFSSGFSIGAILLFLASCSQYSTRPGAITFHNITSRYNAYFIAEQELAEAEFLLQQAYKDDYNQLLPILYPMDSIASGAVKPQLSNAIEKASIVAERHQNSKWLDNSYIVLGKARLYLGQWADGLEALRFVFANGKDEDDKNDALVLLMRAYIIKEDYSNALGVAEYLSQQPLKKEARLQFYLIKAYLHQNNGEYLTSVAILENTFPLLKKSPETARIHFAAGQMYDLLGQYALANQHYKSVGKNSPSYDLNFYSSMNSLQNRVFLNPDIDLSTVGFDKMLKDRKNEDLKDKIYFTMGLLAEHKDNIPEAISYLGKSAALGNKNPTQKAYTYLHLARINYESLEKFEISKAYYDSALVLLPQGILDYQIVSDRKRALDGFVTQYNIVTKEDSLQRLAKLSSTALDSKLDDIIEAREKARIEEEKRQKAILQASTVVSPVVPSSLPAVAGERRWELYDPNLIEKGKLEFKRQWGNRPLEDDWRRSGKTSTASLAGAASAPQNATPEKAVDDKLVKGSEEWEQVKAVLLKNVPLTDEQWLVSEQAKEEALYQLGKIYRFDLKEDKKAISTFERILQEYPESKHKEELYYLMFLSYGAESAQGLAWKQKLTTAFPHSTYARLVSDKTENGADNNALKNPQVAYENSYQLYARGEYDTALKDIEQNLPAYKGGAFEDKFALLRLFLIGKVRGKEDYTQAISEFLQLYPQSIYLERVKEMQELASGSFGRL